MHEDQVYLFVCVGLISYSNISGLMTVVPLVCALYMSVYR